MTSAEKWQRAFKAIEALPKEDYEFLSSLLTFTLVEDDDNEFVYKDDYGTFLQMGDESWFDVDAREVMDKESAEYRIKKLEE